MRKEAVYTVLLNATLFKGMRCFLAQDPRYLRFSVFEGGVASHYNLRVRVAVAALAHSVCIDVELCLSLCAFVTGLEREDRGRAPRGDQRAHSVRVDVCVSRGGRRRRSRRERPPERRGVEMNVYVDVGGGGALCMGGEEASLRV